jgi:hypothetical protein
VEVSNGSVADANATPASFSSRRYLYELLTGCSLQTAPPPYRVTSTGSQARYDDFATGMPAPLASPGAEVPAHPKLGLATAGVS